MVLFNFSYTKSNKSLQVTKLPYSLQAKRSILQAPIQKFTLDLKVAPLPYN